VRIASETPNRRLSSLLTVAAIVVAYLAVAEMVLRFLPVATGLHSVAVSEAQPIFHFEPNHPFVYSRGWNFAGVVRGRVNNAGWVNDQDYARADPTPLIAVIGDSYIEAQMVPYAETLQGRLAAALKGRFRVYSFAAAGAPLGELAVYAGYAVREFGARAVVFNIADYDFASGDSRFGHPEGMWVYDDDGDERRLRLIPYQPAWLHSAARYSALLRYLWINLRLDRPLAKFGLVAGLTPTGSAFAAEADPSAARKVAGQGVIDAFFRDLPRLCPLPAERLLFVMDGFRYPDRAAGQIGSADDRMRQAFRAAAEGHGYEAVDLDPIFFARYRENHTSFEIPGDPHWGSEGHAVAAEGALSSRLIRDLR
jgi:hypothetical protein